MAGVETEVAIMRVELTAHLAADKEALTEIRGSMARQEAMMSRFIDKQEASIARVHDRISEAEGAARDGDKILAEAIALADAKISESKVWVLSSIVAGLLAILSAGWEFVTSTVRSHGG